MHQIFADKSSPKPIKEREANQNIGNAGYKVPGSETSISGPVMAYPVNLQTTTPRIPQPKIDATDRRQIEAINEDKSHSTKETLDDIRRIHYKEKNKKERKDAEINHAGTISEESV